MHIVPDRRQVKRYRLAAFLTVILMAAMILYMPAGAFAAGLMKPSVLSDGTPDPVTDGADLLTPDQETYLRDKISQIRYEYGFDVVVLTVNSLEGLTATEYADDFFDYGGFGVDEDNSGILLLVDMGDRSWATSTRGLGIEYFDDSRLYDMEDDIIPYLSEGDYYGAFGKYVNTVESRLSSIRASQTFDGTDVVISLFIGCLLALIPLGIQLYKMKSVRQAKGADVYHEEGGLKLRVSNDQFLRHMVTKTPIPKETRSGGSSTHFSSSGASHGGHSGHF